MEQINKDKLYEVMKEPNRENVRMLLQNHLGEEDNLDFKKDWLDKEKEAKHILALANTGGGCVVFGVAQQDDGTFLPEGLEMLKDPAELRKEVGRYLPSDVKYYLKDFVFENSEYEALKGKKIQILIVEDVPTGIPFVCCKDGQTIKDGDIFVRKDTESIKANTYDIDRMITRKMNALNMPIKKEISLDTHLSQLKKLYNELTYTTKQGGITELLIKTMENLTGGTVTTHKKECYPKEDYDTFVVKLIEKKKKRIEAELGV